MLGSFLSHPYSISDVVNDLRGFWTGLIELKTDGVGGRSDLRRNGCT
jgi:hypothetical protein